MSITDLINVTYKIYGQDDFSFDQHQAVMHEIDRNMESMDLIEAAAAFRYLDKVAIFMATVEKGWTAEAGSSPDGKFRFLKRLDESRYTEEIILMKRLQEKFHIGLALQEWVERGRQALVADLQQDDFRRRLYTWGQMEPEKRKELLTETLRRQFICFANGEFDFIMPEIILAEESSLFNGAAPIDGQKIHINRLLLAEKDGYDAVSTMFHEGIHSMMSQLIYAAGNGDIAESSPLYEDIRRRAAHKMEYVYARGEIDGIYRSDPEEHLIRTHQDRLIPEIYTDNSPRSQFRLATHKAMNYMRRDMPKVAQFLQRFIPY